MSLFDFDATDGMFSTEIVENTVEVVTTEEPPKLRPLLPKPVEEPNPEHNVTSLPSHVPITILMNSLSKPQRPLLPKPNVSTTVVPETRIPQQNQTCCQCVLQCLKSQCSCLAAGISCISCRLGNCVSVSKDRVDSTAVTCECRRSSCRMWKCRCYKAKIPCGEKCKCTRCGNSIKDVNPSAVMKDSEQPPIQNISKEHLPQNYRYLLSKQKNCLRIKNIVTGEQARKWISEFSSTSNVTWLVSKTCVRQKGHMNSFRLVLRCQHNTRQKKGTESEKQSKNTNCPASLKIEIRNSSVNKFVDPLATEWPCVVTFRSNHNHPAEVIPMLKSCILPGETRQKMKSLFHRGHSPASALKCLETFKILLSTNSTKQQEDHCVPNISSLKSMYKREFKMCTEDKVFADLKNHANVAGVSLFIAEDKSYVSIATSIMVRARQLLASSSRMIHLSGTEKGPKIYVEVVLPYIPLGVVVTASNNDSAFTQGLAALQTNILPNAIIASAKFVEVLYTLFPNSAISSKEQCEHVVARLVTESIFQQLQTFTVPQIVDYVLTCYDQYIQIRLKDWEQQRYNKSLATNMLVGALQGDDDRSSVIDLNIGTCSCEAVSPCQHLSAAVVQYEIDQIECRVLQVPKHILNKIIINGESPAEDVQVGNKDASYLQDKLKELFQRLENGLQRNTALFQPAIEQMLYNAQEMVNDDYSLAIAACNFGKCIPNKTVMYAL